MGEQDSTPPGAGQPEDPDSGAVPSRPAGAIGADLAADLQVEPADGQPGTSTPSASTRPERTSQDPGPASGATGSVAAKTPPGSGTKSEARTFDPLIGRVVFDRYEILRRIGSGGMGAVYVGKQLAVGREVALKVLRADLLNNEHVRQRFRREAEIIGQLTHPNTIQLIDYGELDEGLAIMVMELLHGLPLNEALKNYGPLSLSQTLDLGIEVSGALSEAHQAGMVHRDLKPANIFLSKVGEATHAKVLDFGIARLLDEEATRLTSTGQVFGTPRYMSPEQAMSTGEVDSRSDIYSLGLILYECLVGQPPFVAQTSLQYLSAHTTQTPPKLRESYPDAPQPLEELIDACLEKEAEKRPPSATQVAMTLNAIKTSLEAGSLTGGITIPRGNTVPAGIHTEPPSTAPEHIDSSPVIEGRPERTENSPKLALMALVAVALLLGVGVWAKSAGYFGSKVEPINPPVAVADAGTEASLDAGMVIAEGPKPDAEVAVTEPADAGLTEQPDAQTTVVKRDGSAPTPKPDAGKRKRPRRPRTKGPAVGTGATTGPRGMVIDLGGEDEDEALLAAAKRCKKSVWAGLSRLSTRNCPSGCSIIVDDQCAGLTPAAERPIAPGQRNVAVVCKGRIRRAATVRFTAEQNTRFSCR